MILSNKNKCCGCTACVQICPKHCISFEQDNEGFFYPIVNEKDCIDCHKCEKVCPELYTNEPRLPLKVYALRHRNDNIRLASSSGGAFTLLAKKTLQKNGVVFGACFNAHWEVVHDYIENMDDIYRFQGSKYVQSQIGKSYQMAASFLKDGREVLFSGTPCQVAGLNRFLGKKYKNLTTVDFICHGVPSPGVWKRYLNETIARMCDENSVLSNHKTLFSECDTLIKGISFRNKTFGWRKFSFALTLSTPPGSGENTVLLLQPANENPFLNGFLSNLYLRPSCYHCNFKSGKSGSDYTMADLWGGNDICPEFCMDDKGCSALYVYDNNKPLELNQNEGEFREVSLQKCISHNPSFHYSVDYRKKRYLFFSQITSNQPIIDLIAKYAPFSFMEKIFRYIHNKFKKR